MFELNLKRFRAHFLIGAMALSLGTGVLPLQPA